ncbi:hypothetical protein [Fontivita pretiosa]|uniref:hypothetical protein n=1 Tax=Fontivita pretiosa TaxID=2989684 RepID=UPI003D172885
MWPTATTVNDADDARAPAAADASAVCPREDTAARTSRGYSGICVSIVHATLLLAGIVIVCFAATLGLELRTQLWQRTTSVRFTGDIANGFNWGNRIVELARGRAALAPQDRLTWAQFLVGYFHAYDQVDAKSPDGEYRLDYTPLRLLIMSAWVKHVRDSVPAEQARGYRDQFTSPLLMLNTICEAAAAAGMFVLVFHWLRRTGRSLVISSALALLAGLVSWFNPSNLLNAHVWPQWDLWLVPFVLWGMWLMSIRRWFAAGMLIGIAAMLKGQVLMVAPLFVLWPVLAGRVGAAIGAVLGALTAVGCVVGVWLVGSWTGAAWVATVMLASIVLCLFWLMRQGAQRSRGKLDRWWVIAIAVIVLGAVLAWPWMTAAHWHGLWIGPALVVALLAATRWLPRRAWPCMTLAAALTALIIASIRFDGSWAWFRIGYAYPTRHYQTLAMGPTSNLPALLARTPYGWKLYDPVTTVSLPILGSTTITMKSALIAGYTIALLLCAAAAAVHHRRNDPRLLIALLAPWILMFAILPQMHERYLVWAAAIGGIGLAVSPGAGLLHLLLIAISAAMHAHQILSRDRNFAPELLRLAEWTHPGIGFAVLLLAMVYLYLACTPSAASTTRSARHCFG